MCQDCCFAAKRERTPKTRTGKIPYPTQTLLTRSGQSLRSRRGAAVRQPLLPTARRKTWRRAVVEGAEAEEEAVGEEEAGVARRAAAG